MDRTFYGLLETAWKTSPVCVGLDPDPDYFPTHLLSEYKNDYGSMIRVFNEQIIDATHDLVCGYKMNWAQYLALGRPGLYALERTMDHIRIRAPKAVAILDAKPGDGDNTNKFYVRAAFDELKADAVTANPYMGGYDTFAPFLERKDKGVIFLCKTSNKDSGTFQDLKVNGGVKLYTKVAQTIARWNGIHRNCGLVVGATFPVALAIVRDVVGDAMPLLAPGVGRQGGDPRKALRAGRNSRGTGMIISSSTSIVYASKDEYFAQASRKALTALIHQAQPLTLSRNK